MHRTLVVSLLVLLLLVGLAAAVLALAVAGLADLPEAKVPLTSTFLTGTDKSWLPVSSKTALPCRLTGCRPRWPRPLLPWKTIDFTGISALTYRHCCGHCGATCWPGARAVQYGAYFIDYLVERELAAIFPDNPQIVYRGGLQVHTTLDREMQRAAEEAVKNLLPVLGAGEQGEQQPQVALVAVDPRDGGIRALAATFATASSTGLFRPQGPGVPRARRLSPLSLPPLWNPASHRPISGSASRFPLPFRDRPNLTCLKNTGGNSSARSPCDVRWPAQATSWPSSRIWK